MLAIAYWRELLLVRQLFGSAIVLAIQLGYEFFFLSKKNGQTIGKQVMNVRVVYEDGRPLDQDGTLRRLIIPALGSITGLINGLATLMMIFADQNKQVPHDKVAKTVEIKA